MKLRQKFCAAALLLVFLAAVPSAAYGEAAPKGTEAKLEVYTEATKPNADTSGDGSRENPYNRFEDAVANVADGGTIYILGSGAFINVREEAGVSPYVVGKNVTVRPAGSGQATLNTRAAGLVLGGDVTFENITFGFVNKYHSGIFANGHNLILKNAARESGSRLVHVFAGGLKNPNGTWIGAAPVSGGSVTISGEQTHLGDIYAGGLNAGQEGDVVLDITGSTNIVIGNVYACGADEPDLSQDNMFDINEPPDPQYNLSFSVSGEARVKLANASVREVVGLGAAGGTSVTFSTEFLNSYLSLRGIRNLAVTAGALEPQTLTSGNGGTGFGEISIGEGAVLNVAGNEEPIVTEKFYGGGKLILGSTEKLTVTEELTGTTAFETPGGYGGRSGRVQTEHVYIEGPESSTGSFTFVPDFSQVGYAIASELSGGKKLWSIHGGEASVPYLTKLECASPEQTVHQSDLTDGTTFTMTVQSESDGFPVFAFKMKLDGKDQELKADLDYNSADAEEANVSVFMVPKLDSDEEYELCIESLDPFGKAKSGLYEITVSAPSKDGVLSSTVRLTVLSDSGSSEGGSGGDNTGGDNTGGDNTGGDNTDGDNTGGDNTGGGNTGGDNTGGTGGSTGGSSGQQPDVPVTPSDPEIPPASQLFIDVKAGSWYESSVSFTAHRGLFVGVGNNRFDPSGKTSRAMVMTVIAKMAGQNVHNYDEAVKWAVSAGVSDGTNRHKNVTREQLVAMLYRYAGSPEAANDAGLEAFTDRGQISRWAEEAMKWAVSTGLLKGQGNGRLTPLATATRAETAAIIERFVKLREQ